MSNRKRNTIARLRRVLRPLLYPTGIVDESEPDGRMRLYLFQHRPGGTHDFWREPKDDEEPEHGAVRAIGDIYRSPWCNRPGESISYFHGFCANGIVDDICVGLTTYPFCGLSLRTLESLERLVRRLRERAKRVPRGEEIN